jgi:Reverse transcriptase (RNA-dependent DNA polymerase)
VPLKRGSPYDKGYWNQDCRNAVLYTRWLRRLYANQPSPETWELFRKQRNYKGRVLAKAKRDFYRERVKEISSTEPWSLYKWAKKRSKQRIITTIPTLREGEVTAFSLKEKARLLRDTAFPKPIEADLTDTLNYTYPSPLETEGELSIEEIQTAWLKSKPDKAPGPDKVPNRIIHILIRNRINLLKRLYQACWDISYHPSIFHQAITVFIPKEGKSDYTKPSAYRPIALLNTLGKALESVIANRLKGVTEKFNLLPNTQHGARPMRSTESALFLLREKIKAILGYRRVPSLLTLDVQKAFDNVSHRRLIHDLRKRKVPSRIIGWIYSFLSDRSTSVRLLDYESRIERVELGIPQGSPISPILYLFYNADLLESCEDIAISTSPLGFADDISLLVHSTSIARNCQNLEKAYQKCLKWAKTHGSKFNPEKFELIHFTGRQRRSQENSLNLQGQEIKPSKSIRLLGVYINKGLTYKAHFNTLKGKIPTLLSALKLLTQSTWGYSLEAARALYRGAIRPVISYAALAWFPGDLAGSKKLRSDLQSIQGRFLRAIAGAYKATATEALEIETFIEPLDLFIEKAAIQGTSRQLLRGYGEEIHLYTEKLERLYRIRRRKRTRSSPNTSPDYEKVIKMQSERGIPAILPIPSTLETQEDYKKAWTRYKRLLEGYYAIKWKERWITGKKGRIIATYNPIPTPKALNLYKDRTKAFSSILILLRTQKIGLNSFLHRMGVPGIDALCDCEEEEETVEHFLYKCSKWNDYRNILGDFTLKSLAETLQSREGSYRAARFLLATKRLEQFSLVDSSLVTEG